MRAQHEHCATIRRADHPRCVHAMSTARPFAVEIIRDALTLSSLRADWWDLWQRAPHATPFQSPAWLMPWWDVFAPGALASIAVRNGGKLVGLAPLYLESGALGLRLLPLGIGIS